MTAGRAPAAAHIGQAPASQIRRTRTGVQRSVLVLASSIVVAFLAAANAPSPLYERYETAWHASPLIETMPLLGTGHFALKEEVGLIAERLRDFLTRHAS